MENVKTYVSSNGLKIFYKVTYRKYHVVTIPRFIFFVVVIFSSCTDAKWVELYFSWEDGTSAYLPHIGHWWQMKKIMWQFLAWWTNRFIRVTYYNMCEGVVLPGAQIEWLKSSYSTKPPHQHEDDSGNLHLWSPVHLF